jgi:hypothetical protein
MQGAGWRVDDAYLAACPLSVQYLASSMTRSPPGVRRFFFSTHHPGIDVGPATPPALAKTEVVNMTALPLQPCELAFA